MCGIQQTYVRSFASQKATARPLGMGLQGERRSSRGCDLWLLTVGLDSGMAPDLEDSWYQNGNKMGLSRQSKAQGRVAAISESHTFLGVSVE